MATTQTTDIRGYNGDHITPTVAMVQIGYQDPKEERTEYLFCLRPPIVRWLKVTCIMTTKRTKFEYNVQQARVRNLPPMKAARSYSQLRNVIRQGLEEAGYHITKFPSDVIMEDTSYD